jgi:hypothetical protein
MNPPDVHIDRLALRVSGLDEGAARALARLVADKLAPGLTPGPAGPDSPPADPDAGGTLDELARRIADQVARAWEATP